MAHYAETTEVPIDRSRAEIERTLERYGATAFMYGWDTRRAAISFDVAGRRYRIVLPLPEKNDRAFTHSPTGRERTSNSASAAFEQARRQRWRALALWIKAVLEAAEAGIISIEEALLPFVVLPNGQTAGQWLAPQIAQAYRIGNMPAFLQLSSDERDLGVAG
jgi:hypothetical protein